MSRPARRLTAAVAVAASAALTVVPASAGTTSRAGPPPGYTTNCPPATSLVADTHWWTRRLAPGVVLREGRHHAREGFVRMHVLTADVTNPHLAFRPLLRKLSMRTRLTSYASHRRLVAATNAGYFDLRTGAPLGPAVESGRPILTTQTSTNVVGFARNGLLQAGRLAAAGVAQARAGELDIAGLNAPIPGYGITAYNSRWGRVPVALYRGVVSRYVRHGFVASATRRFARAPGSGYLLVARGHRGVRWLRSLHRAARIRLHFGLLSDAARPFRLAYAVGGRITQDGVGLDGLTCPKREPQPARTAVGFGDGGRRLFLVSVDDNLRTPLHGLDSVQLGRVMADLGASDAFLFDGGGSTTMVARMHPHARRLSLRTQTADRVERAVPLGFGIFRR